MSFRSYIEQIPPISSALAETPRQLVEEAKWQYRQLQLQHNAHPNPEPSTSSSSPPHICTFYRSRFETATEDLSDDERFRLLTICFAYKTAKQVYQYLSLLSSSPSSSRSSTSFSWLPKFLTIMRTLAVDSLRPAKEVSCRGYRLSVVSIADEEKLNTLTEYARGKELRRVLDMRDAPESQMAMPFVVPTLPLAYPTVFFHIWAMVGDNPGLDDPPTLDLSKPLHRRIRFNSAAGVEWLKEHPAAMCLSLNYDVRQRVLHPSLTRLKEEWRASTFYEHDWEDFWLHLGSYDAGLVDAKNGAKWYRESSQEQLEDWLSGWMEVRKDKLRDIGIDDDTESNLDSDSDDHDGEEALLVDMLDEDDVEDDELEEDEKENAPLLQNDDPMDIDDEDIQKPPRRRNPPRKTAKDTTTPQSNQTHQEPRKPTRTITLPRIRKIIGQRDLEALQDGEVWLNEDPPLSNHRRSSNNKKRRVTRATASAGVGKNNKNNPTSEKPTRNTRNGKSTQNQGGRDPGSRNGGGRPDGPARRQAAKNAERGIASDLEVFRKTR